MPGKQEVKLMITRDELKYALMLPSLPGSLNQTSWDYLMTEFSRKEGLQDVVNCPPGAYIIEVYDRDLEEFVLLDKQQPIENLSKLRIIPRHNLSATSSMAMSTSGLSTPSASSTASPSASPVPRHSPKVDTHLTIHQSSSTSNTSSSHNRLSAVVHNIPTALNVPNTSGETSKSKTAQAAALGQSLKQALLNPAPLQNNTQAVPPSVALHPPSPAELSSAIPLEVIEALNGKDEKFRKYILSVFKKDETTRSLNQALLLCLVEKCEFYVSGCQWNEEALWSDIAAEAQHYINRNRAGKRSAPDVRLKISSSKCKEAFVKILLLYKRILHEASSMMEARCLWPKYVTLLDKKLVRSDLLSKIGLGEREINAIMALRDKFKASEPTSSTDPSSSRSKITVAPDETTSNNISTSSPSSDQKIEALNEDLIIKRFWGKRDYYLDENLNEQQIFEELAMDMSFEAEIDPAKCRDLFFKNVLKYIAVLECAGSLREAHAMWPDYFLIMDKVITGRCILSKIGFTHQQRIGIFSLKRGLMERMENELREKMRRKGRSDKQSRKALLNIKIRTLLEFVRHKLVYEPDSWSNLEEFWEAISQELNLWDLDSTATEAQYLFENQIVIYFERLRSCGNEREGMKKFQHFHFIHTHLANQATLTTLGLGHYIEQMEESQRVFYERQFPALGEEPDKHEAAKGAESDLESLEFSETETESDSESDTGSTNEKSSTCSSNANSLKMSLLGDVLSNLKVK